MAVIEKEREKKRLVLTTEHVDLYYICSFDTGKTVDTVSTIDYILNEFSRYSYPIAAIFVPLPRIKSFEEKGWKRLDTVGIWVRPYIKMPKEVPSDVYNYFKNRLLADLTIFSIEYLEKMEFGRIFLGEVVIRLEDIKKEEFPEIARMRGYLELFVHKSGVFVLTLTIPVHDFRLTSTDVLKLRYILEVEGAVIELPMRVYMTWLFLKTGRRPSIEKLEKAFMKAKIWDVIEVYSTFIKYLLRKHDGVEPKSLFELESTLRNPWDINYVVLFTEVLKGERRVLELLRTYSIQIYAMLHGTRRIASREIIRRTIRKSFYYIPTQNIGELVSKPFSKINVTRVTALIAETNTHIVAISRKYLGSTDIGLRLRLKHLNVLELVNHLKQLLRVFEYQFTHRRPQDLDELISLREDYSRALDLAQNNYFIIDKDMKELFYYAIKALEINKLMLSVERKFESLNYIIMTRYQDKINKMQLVLSVLLGIFGVPFFLFSYMHWYFDYVITGRSTSFWPVTLTTFIPTLIILLITLILYVKWKKEIFV